MSVHSVAMILEVVRGEDPSRRRSVGSAYASDGGLAGLGTVREGLLAVEWDLAHEGDGVLLRHTRL
jgi:hypothetical protein